MVEIRQFSGGVKACACGTCGTWNRGSAAVLVLVFAHVLGAQVRGAVETPDENVFIWNMSNDLMMKAASKEDFGRIAENYGKLVRMGVYNGPLFYNLGTAQLMAGRNAEALRNLRRAERYSGTTADIEANMRAALGEPGDTGEAYLPWYRVPLFWHFGLPLRIRLGVTVCAFAGIWVVLSLNALGVRRLVPGLLAACILLAAVFGSSAATSVLQEISDRKIDFVLSRYESGNNLK